MRKFYSLFTCLLLTVISNAQLSGIKTIPGTYATIAAAVADLNTQGVGAGGVTFNIAAAYTESTADSIYVTATGTAANRIVFQKNGAGANPKVTRTGTGLLTTSTLGGNGDAVILIEGSDYVTFDGIDVATADAGIEYGYFFRKASATDGCKNDTIRNSAITLTKGTSAFVIGIYASNNFKGQSLASATGLILTDIGGRNENLTFTGNTVSNVFSGIYVRGFAAASPYDLYDQNITIGASGAGNTIQNYAGNAAATSYGIYMIYQTNENTSFNTINNVAGGGVAATSTLYGIFLSSTSLPGVFTANNNTVNLTQGSTSATNYIYNGNSGTVINISNNTFASGGLASTSTSYIIYASSATPDVNITGNQSTGTISKTGASGALYCYYNLGSPASGTETITNNNFSNISASGTSALYGIYTNTASGQNRVCSNNSISSFTNGTGALYAYYLLSPTINQVNNNVAFSLTSGGAAWGLYATGVNANVYNNSIYNITTTGTTVYGLYVSPSGTSTFYKNKIYNLTSSNASAVLYGVYVLGGTNNTLFNNIIGDLKTPSSSSVTGLAGIYIGGGTLNNVYYNSVYLNASSTGTNFGSYGLYATTSSTVVLKNNNIVNVSTPAGTGATIAYRRSSTTISSYDPSSNNNNFYAGTPGASNVIYSDGTNTDQTLSAFKSRVAPREAGSVSELPPYISTNSSDATYLHINTTTPTQLESAGTPITNITDDFDGNSRNTSTPDIGADEFNGLVSDMTGPTIIYQSLNFTCNTGNRILSGVNIIDATGVPTSGSFVPRVYYNKNNGTWYSAPGTLAAGTGLNGTWSFTIASSDVGGLVIGDTIKYYVIAQDLVATPNIASNPVGAVATNVNSVSTHPAAPNAYSINGNLAAGTITVGTGGTYPSITAAMNAYANSCPTGAITFSLTDPAYGSSETFPIVFNQSAFSSATNILTLKPASGVTPVISGSSATSILQINGGDYFVLDGSNQVSGTSKDLTISNTNTSTASNAINIAGASGGQGATNVVIKNTNVFAGAFASLSGPTGISVSGDDNDNLSILNNAVRRSSIGINVTTTTTTGLNDNLLISGNTIGSIAATDTVSFGGINVSNSPSATISKNQVLNINSRFAGNNYGIQVGANSTAAKITANLITDVKNQNTGGYGAFGINLSSSSPSIEISNNMISGMTTINYSVVSLTFNPFGIRVTDGVNHKIYYNSVNLYGNQFSSGTAATLSAAFVITSSAVTGIDIRDNVFANSLSGLALSKSYGIYIPSGTGLGTINYNDYYASGTYGVLGYYGSDKATLTDFQTATGQDANSKAVDPLYVSNTDLHLQAASPLQNAGIPIGSITVDFDGDGRSVTASEIGADEAPGALPVTLSDLRGERFATYNKLTWKTLTEVNNKGFELQRSADGINFSELAFISSKASNGSSTANLAYEFADLKPFGGNAYYRLKQVDKDGKGTFSNMVLLKGVKVNTISLSAMYPNPAVAKLTLVVSSPVTGKATFRITDLSGRIVTQQVQQLSTGDNNIAIDVAKLAKGTYLVSISGSHDANNITEKFMKQ